MSPRERFRVYPEDEFFALSERAGETAQDDFARAPVDCDLPAGLDARTRGAVYARVVFGAALAAGTGALGLVLALNLASPTHGRRKAALRAARASVPAAATTARQAPMHIARGMRRIGLDGRARQRRTVSVPGDARRRARTSLTRHARTRLDGAAATSPASPVSPGDRVVVSDGAPASGPGDERKGTEIAAASASDSGHAGHGEFGFER